MDNHYRVLARKYRPRNFAELVGQKYTVRSLTGALEAKNLHHAFLFTGTRGVGKTTIARILAKSFNCEKGISAKPCGVCDTCVEIDNGRSIDLIEFDAASRTGVDDMREILENAQYMPSKNRFKIYLIDEVHMLSKSSFNALLKTLEEPPEHIKFLFATTEAKKLPITVLSRCLQFTLQKLSIDEIFDQLKKIMTAEGWDYDEGALRRIAELGDGSMRDALSLLDQSVAYGKGNVREADIHEMLGKVAGNEVLKLAQSLFAGDVETLIEFGKTHARAGENLETALVDLTNILHRTALAQNAAKDDFPEEIQELAKNIDPLDLQLFYQIAINGLRDFSHAPSDEVAFEMTLLRMVAFQDDKKITVGGKNPGGKSSTKSVKKSTEKSSQKSNEKSAEKSTEELTKNLTKKPTKKSAENSSEKSTKKLTENLSENSTKKTEEKLSEKSTEKAVEKMQKPTLKIENQDDWVAIFSTLDLSGAPLLLLKNSIFGGLRDDALILILDRDYQNLLTASARLEIEKSLRKNFGKITIDWQVGEVGENSAHKKEAAQKKHNEQRMQDDFLNDPVVQKIQQKFAAKVDLKTIQEI